MIGGDPDEGAGGSAHARDETVDLEHDERVRSENLKKMKK